MIKYGFNFLWMFVHHGQPPAPVAENELDFLADHGFNFVRIPTDYNFWTKDYDYFHPNEDVFGHIDRYLAACRERGLHMCLNLHRAPGYCINRNDREKHNLWVDEIAQDAFVFLWETFARRYLGISSRELSFDLVNEPADIGQYGLTRDRHEALMRRTIKAIRAIDPQREIVLDGLGGGNLAMPELADAGVVHSGRGYQPMCISHYQAEWWKGHEGLQEPFYPGIEWMGRVWNKETLREFYQPWVDVQNMGAQIHIGEFGCYDKTHNDVALAWFKDLLSLFKDLKWGYSLWNFKGAFGIVEHGRPGTVYDDYKGFKVDRKLLELYLENRVIE